MQLLVCETAEQLRQAMQLRYEVYCLEKGWIDPAPFTDGIETDEWDAEAVHFLVRSDEGVPLGTARFLLGSRQVLPAATFIDFHNVGVDPRRCVEVSRMASLRDSRSQDMAVFMSLTKVMWDWGMANGITSWACVADLPVFLLMKRMRFPFIAAGDQVDYLGSPCVPAIIDGARMQSVLVSRGFADAAVA